jgi:hypothetical protein
MLSPVMRQPERFSAATYAQSGLLSWLTPMGPWWWAIWISALAWTRTFATEPTSNGVDFEAQARVVQLLQTIIQDYWGGNRTATNAAGSNTNVESAFREASRLMPTRLDLRYGLASSLVSQAVQTNGAELKLKLDAALRVYQEIEALDTNAFEAAILQAAYKRAVGDLAESNDLLAQLSRSHPQSTAPYLDKFAVVDRILEMTPSQNPSRNMPRDQGHAIVVLGAGLETNGLMKAKLLGRLHQALRLARIYRKAPMVVTGGNQQGGVTEAYVMATWLRQHGVNRKRIYLEDKARDTVENALFSSKILQRLGVTHVTVVTSSNHIHRGLVDLQEACRQRGLEVKFDSLACTTKGDTALDPVQERLGVYRDLMRVSGIWAYPGLQR